MVQEVNTQEIHTNLMTAMKTQAFTYTKLCRRCASYYQQEVSKTGIRAVPDPSSPDYTKELTTLQTTYNTIKRKACARCKKVLESQ